MFAELKKLVSGAAIGGLVLAGASVGAQAAETGLQPDGRLIVSQDASKVIGEYLRKVSGRFGALSISADGTAAVYYICQSRLWKNCDDYSLEDSFMAIPSGQIAAKLSQSRCRGVTGSNCTLLFVNDAWKHEFTLAQ